MPEAALVSTSSTRAIWSYSTGSWIIPIRILGSDAHGDHDGPLRHEDVYGIEDVEYFAALRVDAERLERFLPRQLSHLLRLDHGHGCPSNSLRADCIVAGAPYFDKSDGRGAGSRSPRKTAIGDPSATNADVGGRLNAAPYSRP